MTIIVHIINLRKEGVTKHKSIRALHDRRYITSRVTQPGFCLTTQQNVSSLWTLPHKNNLEQVRVAERFDLQAV
jgi:hypothetical protein